jgi:hypothetical protein
MERRCVAVAVGGAQPGRGGQRVCRVRIQAGTDPLFLPALGTVATARNLPLLLLLLLLPRQPQHELDDAVLQRLATLHGATVHGSPQHLAQGCGCDGIAACQPKRATATLDH